MDTLCKRLLSKRDIHGGAVYGENGHMNYIKELRDAEGWSMQQLGVPDP